MYQKFEKIISVENIGQVETMDLEINSQFHNFYANGVCVSNSHSVAYSYLAAQTLFLKRYYPTEFYTALLNHPKSTPDKDGEQKWLTSAILSAMKKGIKIIPPTRQSKWEWTMIDDTTIAMGMSSVDGLGEIAYGELVQARIEQISKEGFFNYPFKKFNKKSFENCVKAGLFDDWSDSREELFFLNEQRKKRTTKKSVVTSNQMAFFDIPSNEENVEVESKTFVQTSKSEKYKQFIEVCKLDLQMIDNIFRIKKEFFDEYQIELDSIMNFDDPKKYYFFYINSIDQAKTKNGKPYYVLKIGDGINTKRMSMWNEQYEKNKAVLEIGCFYISKFYKQNDKWLSFDTSAPFRKLT